MKSRGRLGAWCLWATLAAGCAPSNGGDARPSLDARPSSDGFDASVDARDVQIQPQDEFFTTDPQLLHDAAVRPLPELSAPTRPPPPISGGSMLTTRDGARFVVGDSDRDVVWVVDAASLAVQRRIDLTTGDEPGRLVEDARGRVHVVLRSAGAVATVDVETGALVARRAVCPIPRGITVASAPAALYVACAGGELVTLPLDDLSAPGTAVTLEPDLRDVIIHQGSLVVSTFREARVLFVDRSSLRVVASRSLFRGGDDRVPNTAWRMIALASGQIAVAHQRSARRMLAPTRGGYFAPRFDPTIAGAVAVFSDAVREPQLLFSDAVLPVDLVEGTRSTLWLVSAGNRGLSDEVGGAGVLRSVYRADLALGGSNMTAGWWAGRITSGAQVGDRTLFFNRQPAGLVDNEGRLHPFADAARVDDTGHDLFHTAYHEESRIACASCHPEGGDDHLVWSFTAGALRTPSLLGTIADTAPYHWNGEFNSLTELAHDVFTGRMGGPSLGPSYQIALQRWIEGLRAPPVAPLDAEGRALAARGEAVFRSDIAGCAGCHSGPRFTNNATVDVGTSGRFQVPSLIGLRWHAPYMHNGCAATLDDRFTTMGCAGDARHGGFGLSVSEREALVAFLRTL